MGYELQALDLEKTTHTETAARSSLRERGQAAAEYAVMCGVVLAVLVVVVRAFSSYLNQLFLQAANKVQ